MRIRHRRLTRKLLMATLLSLVLILGWSWTAKAQFDDEENYSLFHDLGIGVQNSGAACCISIRAWTTPTGGIELDLAANRLLFLTTRGLTKFVDSSIVDAYGGAGLVFVFSPLRSTSRFPIDALQLLLGLEITVPFMPAFAINTEGVLEFEPEREFFTTIGVGIHYYF